MSTQCNQCPIGRMMAHGEGGFCPFLEEPHPAGTVIFKAGELAEFAYFLKEGTVGLVEAETKGGHREVTILRGPSDALGPKHIHGGKRTADAIALTDIVTCRGHNTVKGRTTPQ